MYQKEYINYNIFWRKKMKAIKKRRIFEIIQVGKDHDVASITFDFFIAFVIFLNLFVTLSRLLTRRGVICLF